MKYNEITKQQWEDAINNSKSFRELAKHLNIKNRHIIKRMLNELNIDFSRLDRKNHNYLIGSKVGKLTVIGPTIKKVCKSKTRKNTKRTLILCKCECGKIVSKRVDDIKGGRVISCGCAIVDKGRFMLGSNNQAFTGIGDLTGSKFSDIKRCAKRRNIEFSVTKEYLWKLFEQQNRKCALSGQNIWFGRNGFKHETCASLDRIDSKLGYIEGNVQWVHKDINILKRSFSQEYFLEMCKLIADYNS